MIKLSNILVPVDFSQPSSKALRYGMSLALQFGSHVGMGLRLGAPRQASVGVALQHLSNAGIKQPNGGINFYLLTIGVEL